VNVQHLRPECARLGRQLHGRREIAGAEAATELEPAQAHALTLEARHQAVGLRRHAMR